MVTGFELVGLVGTISATLDLIDKFITVVRSYRSYDEDTQRLLTRLLANKSSMKRYLQAMDSLQNGDIEHSVLTDVEIEILTFLSDDLDSIRRRLDVKLGRFNTVSGGNAGVLTKVMWAVWRKASFESDQSLLDDWTQRIGLIYASIEASLSTQRRLLPGADQAADRMARLMSVYRDLGVRGHAGAQSPCITFERLEMLGTQSRRMPAKLNGAGNGVSVTSVLIEYMAKGYSPNLNQAEVSQIGDATLALSRVLQHSDPMITGLPRCCGYFQDRQSYRYGLVYELPPDMWWSNDPKTNLERALSMRDLLNINPRFPLDQRLRFCCDISKAVLYVHLVGWVHKSIRPDNIIFLQRTDASADLRFPYALATPFLAGFEYARSTAEGALSDRKSDADWRHNVYRHPARQGIERNEEYNMAHDVYSLGVVLLEIGMWGSKGFVPFQHQKQEAHFATASGPERKARLLAIADGIADDQGNRYPLATTMGSRFDRLVRYCLNLDEKGGLATAAFIQKIWIELDEIRAAVS
ncbi:hypothetical protein LTR17_016119 [Elasticomyces elasticus]|nr:hypothetical protein LTR17_016119 [Elasticomyces elasticus]